MTLWKLLLPWVTAALRLLQHDLILSLSPCVWSPGHAALTHFALQLWASPFGAEGGCCSCSLPHFVHMNCTGTCERAAPAQGGFKIWAYLRALGCAFSSAEAGVYLEAIMLSIILTGNLNTNLALEYFSLVTAFCKSNLQQSFPSSTQQSEPWHFKWDKAIL